MKSKAEQIEHAKQLLAEAGFKICISGCGCCGSPAVYLEHNGEPIIHRQDLNLQEHDRGYERTEDECSVDMFDG